MNRWRILPNSRNGSQRILIQSPDCGGGAYFVSLDTLPPAFYSFEHPVQGHANYYCVRCFPGNPFSKSSQPPRCLSAYEFNSVNAKSEESSLEISWRTTCQGAYSVDSTVLSQHTLGTCSNFSHNPNILSTPGSLNEQDDLCYVVFQLKGRMRRPQESSTAFLRTKVCDNSTKTHTYCFTKIFKCTRNPIQMFVFQARAL